LEQEILLAILQDEMMISIVDPAMKPSSQAPQPAVPMAEEWDNPAMTEFKRQEAEERLAFGCSKEARQWLEHLRGSSPPDVKIRLAPKVPERFPFKVVRLPW
jgi:hypothetical protein